MLAEAKATWPGDAVFTVAHFRQSGIIHTIIMDKMTYETSRVYIKKLLTRWKDANEAFVIGDPKYNPYYRFSIGDAVGEHPQPHYVFLDTKSNLYILHAKLFKRNRRFIRHKLYGKDYSPLVQKWKDEKLNTPKGQLSPSGYKGLCHPQKPNYYWYDGQWYENIDKTKASIDHKPMIVEHWNSIGRMSTHDVRVSFYNGEGDPETNLTIMPLSLNSSDGQGADPYQRNVELSFRGP